MILNELSLSGRWQCRIPGQNGPVLLPGTLDESGIGFPDDPLQQWKVEEVRRIGFYRDGDPIVTRLTRRRTFTGCAELSRHLSWQVPASRRVFLECERARSLRLFVNRREVLPVRPGSLCTPWCFEVTSLVTGEDELLILSDNSYPGWPADVITYSSAASDETQTNWNGILGFFRLRFEEPVFFSDLRACPRGDTLDTEIEIDAAEPWAGRITLSSPALQEEASLELRAEPGRSVFRFSALPLSPEAERWDLETGTLHALTVSAPDLAPRTVSFGIRDFRASAGHLTLNGRPVFLRSEANCAVFPETGYPPMKVSAWKEILVRYRSYGVNCLRFHSHCPPDAAFTAADEAGILMQPELSHWDPEHAFESPASRAYYETELLETLRFLANHPSFVMLTFGNELHADASGHACMDRLLDAARAFDGTRLYANGSNVHYGELNADPHSDFYTASHVPGEILRATCAGLQGWLNHVPPNTVENYDRGMAVIREKSDQPVFSFEVGQCEVLPDFREINLYRGVTEPANLKHIRRKTEAAGLADTWEKQVEATGELALRCYHAEVEAALRTRGFSGISLLGLQDFPGQGTALVGMMNAHLLPKPYAFAAPERFRAFFRDTLPLALLPRFTWNAGDTLTADILLAHYGRKPVSGIPCWTLESDFFRLKGTLPPAEVPAGELIPLGSLRIPLEGIRRPERITLTLRIGEFTNTYPLWVYPRETIACPNSVLECRSLTPEALEVLARGGRVYLAPDSTEEALPKSLQAQFSTDFWSVCTFPYQTGCMGQLIDAAHPLFAEFPTDFHTDWQWWPMANQRVFRLPERIRAIITELDSYAFLRPLASLFECRCGGGRLLVSSLGLHQLTEYPEARALQNAVYRYLDSDAFSPEQELTPDWIAQLF